MHRRFALVTGFNLHARALARVVNARSSMWRMRFVDMSVRGLPEALLLLPTADAVVCLGGPELNPGLDVAARAFGKPVYIIWVGSDVSNALAHPEITAPLAMRGYVHGAVAPWLVRELRAAGVEAKLLKISAVTRNTDIAPFPATFKVLTYLPNSRRSFYGSERIYALARRFPTVIFHAVGEGVRDPSAPANVQFLGFRPDMSAALDACIVLIRLAEHDGHSVMVNQALARGRHVIWTNVLPGVQCVRSDDETAAVLEALIESHRLGTLTINAAGAAYVRTEYSSEAIVSSVETFLRTHAATRRPQRSRQVAISGPPCAAARACEFALASPSRWNPRLLETSSRVRLLAAMYALAQSDVWYTIASTRLPAQLRFIATLLCKPRIMHWTTGQIALVRSDPVLLRKLRSNDRFAHVASCEANIRALSQLGIHAQSACLPIRFPAAKPPAFPSVFTVLLDVRAAAPVNADNMSCEHLVRAFTGEQIRFLVLGDTRLDCAFDGMLEYIRPHVDRATLYSRCTALLILNDDDDGWTLGLEAIAAGRYVLSSLPFPHVIQVASEADFEHAVRDLLGRHRDGTLPLNEDGARFVRREYNPQTVVAQLETVWNRSAPARLDAVDLAVQT